VDFGVFRGTYRYAKVYRLHSWSQGEKPQKTLETGCHLMRLPKRQVWGKMKRCENTIKRIRESLLSPVASADGDVEAKASRSSASVANKVLHPQKINAHPTWAQSCLINNWMYHSRSVCICTTRVSSNTATLKASFPLRDAVLRASPDGARDAVHRQARVGTEEGPLCMSQVA